MPKIDDDVPKELKPYLFHKLDVKWKGLKDALADCPFCGREGKLGIVPDTGQYRCVVCNESGNSYTFIRQLHASSVSDTNGIEELALDRRVSVETMIKWGLCRSVIDREWVLPSYGPSQINNLYRYTLNGKKRILLSTSTLNHGLFGRQFWNDELYKVYVAEGPWDAMALEDAFAREGKEPDGTIVAVPGCSTFRDEWVRLFRDKEAILLYDSDHPKAGPNGKVLPPVGYNGMKAAARKLKGTAKEISYLAWGLEGYDETLPSGFDVRDLLTTDSVANVS